ncbi:MAG: class I SAM-dependent methyltransferase [Gammaproteobacteria bacterium]|nr:class I SAM-dependent methyltransferase [Gammaproteobacteria bacterium]
MSKKKLGLDDAYAVETPADNIELYRDWAETYDSDFAAPRGYVYPARIAAIYSQLASAYHQPILDVGAGTGLVAEALTAHTSAPIDGIDISQEMLDVSETKGLYRQLICADLTGDLDIASHSYGAIVSAGTFTLGHVGPEALYKLLHIAKPGALFVIGINGVAFDKYGFGSTIATLSADGLITDLNFYHTQYYDNAEDEHAGDRGLTACFHTAS